MTYQVVPHSLFLNLISIFSVKENTLNSTKKMGSHKVEIDGKTGIYFAVWAPNAKQVSVIGDFNNGILEFLNSKSVGMVLGFGKVL